MKASKLRIGNFVSHNNDIYEVEEISNDWLRLNNNQLNTKSKDVNPTRITEQWLTDFGFDWDKGDDDNHWLNLKAWTFTFQSDQSVDFKKVYLRLNEVEVVCKYVHQLQNLYFVLTGDELEVKNEESA